MKMMGKEIIRFSSKQPWWQTLALILSFQYNIRKVPPSTTKFPSERDIRDNRVLQRKGVEYRMIGAPFSLPTINTKVDL